MIRWLKSYSSWLHLQWPAGKVERLPQIDDQGQSSVPGVYIVGDLTGIPLLKFAIESGAKAVRSIVRDPSFQKSIDADLFDVIIIGAGLSGVSAALEARKNDLKILLLEAGELFSTIANFPKGKPIFTYPTEMIPEGQLHINAQSKETLLEELQSQVEGKISIRQGMAEKVERLGANFVVTLLDQSQLQAKRVVIAIGRSGNFRRLNVPGENLNHVFNRLHDPSDYADKKCLVVGGGDSAIETAIALARAGSNVTLSYRKNNFSRAKPDNIDLVKSLHEAGKINLELETQVSEINPKSAVLSGPQSKRQLIDCDVVFIMIGREAPLDFFRRSKIRIQGEWDLKKWASLIGVLSFCVFLYHWKKTGLGGFDHIPFLRALVHIGDLFSQNRWFPYHITDQWASSHSAIGNTLRISLGEPGFYYSLAYCLAVSFFGARRIARRKTPYIKWQTITLALIQIGPLFLLPYIVLPWLGHGGFFDSGIFKTIADHLFPLADYGHGREYWRAFGLVLAWPLFFWNVFTDQPLVAWLIISFVQTGIIIPILIYFWGKGAYCGWICSCGALAETLGDSHRTKMPHGPGWNKLNMAGQFILGLCGLLLALRILGWMDVGWAKNLFQSLFYSLPLFNYVWFVDLLLAGILGVGLYFHFSGRVWCRFFCPLAALMHIYARFSRFRIFSEKKKCISCNVCTSVCHQGIDIMSVANKGIPMNDPQCVRCSACVQSCPTGCLSFGQIDSSSLTITKDRLKAVSLPMGKA